MYICIKHPIVVELVDTPCCHPGVLNKNMRVREPPLNIHIHYI